MQEVSFNLEFENFYCPVTGRQVLDPGQFNHSPAMVFAFVGLENTFEYLRDNFVEKFVGEFNDETKHYENYEKLTQKILVNERNYLLISNGFARTGTASFCFDMEYKNHEQEDQGHPFYGMDNLSVDDEKK